MSKLYRIKIIVFFLIINISANAQINWFKKADTITVPSIEDHITFLASECWKLRSSHSDSALSLGIEALALADKYNITQPVARISNYVGAIYLIYLDNREIAIPFFHRALENSLQYNDSIELAFAYDNLGDAFLYTGNFAVSKQYAEKELEIFEKLNNERGIAYAFYNLGLIYRHAKNYDLSLMYLNQAKEIREKNKDSLAIANSLREMAKTHYEKGDLENSWDIYQRAELYYSSINNERSVAECINGMANIYVLKMDFEKAHEFFSRSAEINQKINHSLGLIDDYLGLAIVYANQNKIKDGKESIAIAHKLSYELAVNSKILKTHETSAKFYEILGDYKMAMIFLYEFNSIKDSLLSIKEFETLNEVRKNYSISQNLDRIQMELGKEKIQKVYLKIIVSLLLLLFVGFLWRLRTRSILTRQLQQINRTKDKLFSVISHDLKSPFTTLLGFSELMITELKNKDYPKVEQYAGILYNSAEESLKLITNLLDWARAHSGKIEYKPEALSLEELFKGLAQFFEILTNKNKVGLEFKNSIDKEIIGDPGIIRIILINLISNALKYTGEGGLIKVSAEKKSSKIIILIEDNGIGMPDDYVKKIFDNTELISSKPGLRKETGTGLGLSICTELIHLHKGSIKVESEWGKGSIFEIKFPLNYSKIHKKN